LDHGADLPISDWLRQRRRQLDLTQQELADQVGCSTVLIRKIEAGERRPSRQIAARLAVVLQVPDMQQERFITLLRQGVWIYPKAFSQEIPLQPLPETPGQPAAEIAAAATLDLARATLPEFSSAFVGREVELELIMARLAGEARLLTLVGAGGMGKTRLAVEAARRLATQQPPIFTQGVDYFSLVSVASPAALPEALGGALGLALGDGQLSRDLLAAHLGTGRRLLVLDNFEHLLPDGLGMLADLLRGAEGLALLVTSRSRLGLVEEWVFEIAGLAYPPEWPLAHTGAAPPDGWEKFSAVQLFIQSARRSSADFNLGPQNAAAVRQVCVLVDGLPLGIELAAAWTRLLPAAEIAGEIQHNLDFLTSNLRDVPERHRSLRAVFDYSWGLLAPVEQQVLAGLSVLAGRFDRTAASAVAGAGLAELAALLDKSLLGRAGGGDFEMHPLLRQFAHERLEASGAAAAARDRHLAYCCSHARELGQAYQQGQVDHWRAGMQAGQANFNAALQYALESRQAEAGLRLAEELWRYWYARGSLVEGATWLRDLLAMDENLPAARRARAWYCLASLEHHRGDYAAAGEHLAQSLQAARQAGDQETLAAVTNELGLLALDHDQPAQAEEHFREGMAAMQALQDRHGEALLAYNLGRAVYARGQRAQAEKLWHDSLALAEALEDLRVQMYARYMLGVHALEAGDLGPAREQFALSLIHTERLGDRFMRTWCLDRMAMLELQAGNPQRAVMHYACSVTLRTQSHLAVPPVHQAEYQAFERQLRQALPEETYRRFWQDGQQQALEELANEP
jgi:predicted ATPase/DNA-binding XRE family transcriptional regulator